MSVRQYTRPFALLSLVFATGAIAQVPAPSHVFGYTDFSAQAKLDSAFMAVPDAKLAGEHLKILTAEPHWASSPEDKKTADYVAQKFRDAGLQTEIVPYSVYLNKPLKIEIEAFDAHGKKLMSGPRRSTSTPRRTAAIPSRTTRAFCLPSTVRRPPAMSPPTSSTPTTAHSPTSKNLPSSASASKARSSSCAMAEISAA